MDLKDYFKNGKVYVWKGTFAIIKKTKWSLKTPLNQISHEILILQGFMNKEVGLN